MPEEQSNDATWLATAVAGLQVGFGVPSSLLCRKGEDFWCLSGLGRQCRDIVRRTAVCYRVHSRQGIQIL
jgi:hypothetical protein